MIFPKLLRYLSAVIGCCVTMVTWAQGNFEDFQARKNRALTELKKYPKQDTNRVKALFDVAFTAVFLKEREEVASYREEGFALSKKLNFPYGLTAYYLMKGSYYKSSSNYPMALASYDSAMAVAREHMADPAVRELKIRLHEQIGRVYYEEQQYYFSLDHFFELLRLTGSPADNRTLRVMVNITDIYIALNNLDKASEYALKNIILAEQIEQVDHCAAVYFRFMDICLMRKEYDLVATYLDKLSPYIPDSTEVQVNYGYYLKRGVLNYELGKYGVANMFFKETYKYARQGGHKKSVNMSLQYLSATALKLGDIEAAREYGMQNLAIAEEINLREQRMGALINLSEYYKAIGNASKAWELMKEANVLKDSLLEEKNIRQANVLGAIYEADKKEKEIAKLHNDRMLQEASVQRKSMLNKVFAGAIVLILLFGYLVYRNVRNKQKISRQQQELQRQQIVELEKDKQLLAIDSMLKGQEEERSRIAKDLHDGLGSLLYGTKLSFINLRENLPISPENNVLFEKSMSMLDNTIGDLRKVAQNLMPEALVKFGLNEALRDLCDFVQSTTGIRIIYQYFGDKRKLDSTAEVYIFRIIQELINNAVKHSGATQVLVQLTVSDGKTGITVEDNGKGFDKNAIVHTKGVGMTSLDYRVQYLNGEWDIVTDPGKGSSVNIELIA